VPEPLACLTVRHYGTSKRRQLLTSRRGVTFGEDLLREPQIPHYTGRLTSAVGDAKRRSVDTLLFKKCVLLWSLKVQRPFVLHFPEPVEATLHLNVSLNVCFRVILPGLNFHRNVSIFGQKFCMYFSCFEPSYTSRFCYYKDIQRSNVTHEGPRSVIFSILLLLTPRHCSSKRTRPFLTISYSQVAKFCISTKSFSWYVRKMGRVFDIFGARGSR
jgi:hypothetical protein